MLEHHRRIKDFLKRYGASEIHFRPGGKHPKVLFKFRGESYERVIAASPSDHRAYDNEVSAIRRLLGEPVEAGPKTARSLTEMTPVLPEHVNGNNIASRTISELRNIANGLDPEGAAAVPAPILEPSGIVVKGRYATDVSMFPGGNKDYDFLFRTRRKSVAEDGKITASDPPVALVTVPGEAMVALFDQMQPFVQLLRQGQRPPPVVEVAPAPMPPPSPEKTKRKMRSWEAEMPRGAAHIISLAEAMALAREVAAEQAGTTQGAAYTKRLKKLYAENGELGQMPTQVRGYISDIVPYLDQLREMAKTLPEATLADITPRQLMIRWQRSLTEARMTEEPAPAARPTRLHKKADRDHSEHQPAELAAAEDGS